MTRSQIINKVKKKMNEISPYDSGDIVNNTLVDDMLDESNRTILLIAPVHLLPVTSAEISTGTSIDDKTGYINLPSDYIRFVELKMKDWEKSVVHPITENDPVYRLQKNPFARGDYKSPVVVLVGDKKIEYYSIDSSHEIDFFKYVKDTLPENLTNQKLIDALTWQCAGDCFVALLEPEIAKTAYQKSVEHLK